MNQQHHLPILYLPDSHFDFREFASADVPSGYLKFPCEFSLGPSAIVPDPSHLPTDDVLVLHASAGIQKPCRFPALLLWRCPYPPGFGHASRTTAPNLLASQKRVPSFQSVAQIRFGTHGCLRPLAPAQPFQTGTHSIRKREKRPPKWNLTSPPARDRDPTREFPQSSNTAPRWIAC